jgi:CHAT domain-containing protein
MARQGRAATLLRQDPKYLAHLSMMESLRAQISGLSASAEKMDEKERQARLRDLDRLLYQSELDLDREILADPRLKDPMPASDLNRLKSSLREDEVFLDLLTYEDRTKRRCPEERFAAILTARGRDSEFIDLGNAQEINTAVRNLVNLVILKKEINQKTPQWQEAERLIWKNISDRIPVGTTRIWLCPEGQFATIPWQLLAPSGSRMLISQVDSARELMKLRLPRATPANNKPTVLIAGNIDYEGAGLGKRINQWQPLKKDMDEIGAVSQQFTANHFGVSTLLGRQADKATFKEKLPGARYVHLTTHGMRMDSGAANNYRHPLANSGLALSGANFMDPQRYESLGMITAFELAAMDLSNCELITLSACESGLGEQIVMQGVMGLRASLMAGGARSVLISLWKVDEEATVELMGRFYKYHLGGMSKAMALKRAQADVAAIARWKAPYYWAGWILIGE